MTLKGRHLRKSFGLSVETFFAGIRVLTDLDDSFESTTSMCCWLFLKSRKGLILRMLSFGGGSSEALYSDEQADEIDFGHHERHEKARKDELEAFVFYRRTRRKRRKLTGDTYFGTAKNAKS
jgi:hypothetical protein